MAKGYIGKISAIVTVNTADASRAFNRSAEEAQKYGLSLSRSIDKASRSASSSFESIFTPLQRLSRALQAAGQANFNLKQPASQIERMAVAAKQLSDPLSSAVSGFGRLSDSVQRAFSPALSEAQRRVLEVRDAIQSGKPESVAALNAVKASVDSVVESMTRLQQVASITGRLMSSGDANFVNARQVDSLNRLVKAQQELAQAPAAVRGGGEAKRLIDEAKRLTGVYERLNAVREARLQRGADTSTVDRRIEAITGRIGANAQQTDRLASGDAGLVIARARAEREFDAVRRRLDAAAADDAAAAAAPPINRSRAERESALNFGLDLDAPKRQIEVLRGSITALKGQLDSLPVSVRTQFAPSILEAQRNLERLAASPAATAAEIAKASREVERLTKQADRAKKALTIQSFREFVGNISTKKAIGELQALQQVLSSVEAEAGGPAARAYDRYAAAVRRAVREGTTELPATRKELEKLQIAAAKAAAATGKISFNAALRQIKRGGDVARGTFGNSSLAIQQAIFAVDDFFSVTGDFGQRIRAVGNNLTQLGFILGGTTGLIVSLSAVLAGQALNAIYKWANGGKTGEDQAKALNDTLSRQKSLVDELRQAFESLGDSIAGRAFSQAGKDADQFRKQLADIKKDQVDLRNERLSIATPSAQSERALQKSLQEQAEKATTGEQRLAFEERIRRSQARERGAINTARANGLSAEEVLGTRRLGALQAGRLSSAVARQRQGFDVDIQREIVDALKSTIDQRRGAGLPAELLAPLEALLIRASDQLQGSLDQTSQELLKSGRSASIGIEQAQQDVADAIRRGVPNAGRFASLLDENAKALQAAYTRLDQAQEIRNAPDREAEIEAARRQIDQVRGRRDEITRLAREARLGRTFGGERTTSALSALDGNKRFANEYANLISQVRVAVDNEVQAIKARDQAVSEGNKAAVAAAEADLEAAQRASELAAAAAEAALALEEAVSRIRKVVDGALSTSESFADNAQRNLTERPLQPLAGQREDIARARRDAAEESLISDRLAVARAQNAIDAARSRAFASPEIAAVSAQIEAIRQRREDMAAQARINGGFVDPAQMQALADQEAELIAMRERALSAATQAEREYADAIAQGIQARQRAEESANRGDELRLKEGQRAARDLLQGLEDIRQSFAREAEFGTGLIDQAGQQDAQRRLAIDSMRSVAPAIFGFADSVQNAVLQGPSRAALQAADVSTVEGSRELSRLLRGDDPARNADLVELQKQNEKLQQLIDVIKQTAGITLDL